MYMHKLWTLRTFNIRQLGLSGLSNDRAIRVFCVSVCFIRAFEWRLVYKINV